MKVCFFGLRVLSSTSDPTEYLKRNLGRAKFKVLPRSDLTLRFKKMDRGGVAK